MEYEINGTKYVVITYFNPDSKTLDKLIQQIIERKIEQENRKKD